jgi:hypothetical protein
MIRSWRRRLLAACAACMAVAVVTMSPSVWPAELPDADRGSLVGCFYARAHRSGWVLVVRQVVAQREPPVMLRVWGRVERVPDDDASCLALWERWAHPR